MKKRVLSLFLAITLCLTLTPTGALAAERQPPEQTVSATQEAQIPAPALEEKEEEKTTPAQTGAGENAPPANPEENPTEDAPAAAEKNTADGETDKEAGQNEPTAEGENEPLALGLDDARQNAADGENGEAGDTPISKGDTRPEIWCVSKPDSIGRTYDGTADGSTIPLGTLGFTDGEKSYTLTEGTDFTATKTFDSADAGDRTVTVALKLIGDAATKYKLKADTETFTIGGTINKATPNLTVSLSQTTCAVGETLPLVTSGGAPEGATVTYYYTTYTDSIYSDELAGLNEKIDENTTIPEADTYYIFARSTATTNYKAGTSEPVQLKVVAAAARVTTADGVNSYYEDTDIHAAFDAAASAADSTLTLLQDVTLADKDSIYIDSQNGYNFTIDWNGHTLTGNDYHNLLTLTGVTSVTLQDSSGNNTGGVCNNGSGAAVCISLTSYEYSVTIEGGTYSPQVLKNNCSGAVTISGGVFKGTRALITTYRGDADGTLADLLAAGCTFAYDDGSGTKTPFDVYSTYMSDSGKTVCVIPHPAHTFNTTGKCTACGYTCPHTEIDSSNYCTSCKLPMAAMVTKDGTSRGYTDFSDALANAPEGSTLKLLAIDGGIAEVTLDKALTFDLNGKQIGELWVNAKATIKDSTGGSGCILALRISDDINLTLGDLLEEGYAFLDYNNGWVNLAGKDAHDVSVQQAPIQSLTITADKDTYSPGDKIILTATAVTLDGKTVSTYYWQENDTTLEAPAAGSTLAKNQYSLTASGGSHTFRCMALCDGYSLTSQPLTVTVNRIDLSGATAEVKRFTYNGAAQRPQYYTVTVKLGDNIVKRGYYDVEATPQTDAGEYTLTITGTGNYTGKIENVPWKINPAELTVSAADCTKPYDGGTEVAVTPTFNGLLNGDFLSAEDYSVTAAFNNADVGYNKPITGTVTLNQTAATKNYVLKDNGTFTATGTITKAAAPTGGSVELTIYKGVQREYLVDLPPLPDLENGKSYGAVNYNGAQTISLSEGYTADSIVGGKAGNPNAYQLVLRINQTGSQTGEIGTVTIPVTTTNYTGLTLTVKVKAVNQIIPEKVGTVSADAITYGQTLNDSTITFTGKMTDIAANEEVNGTFTWKDGAVKPDAGSYEAWWLFTPDESYGGKYTTNTGDVTVTVNKADAALTAPTANTLTYNGTEQALVSAGTAIGGTMQYRLGEIGDFSTDIPKAENAGNYTVYYKVVGDNNHNDSTVMNLTVTIDPMKIDHAKFVKDISKAYDGKPTFDLVAEDKASYLTFYDAHMQPISVPAEAYEISGVNFGTQDADHNFVPSAKVGDKPGIQFTVEFKSSNYVLQADDVDEPTLALTYTQYGGANFTITKGDLIFSGITITNVPVQLLVTNDLERTYEIDLPKYRWPLAAPCEYGNVSYTLKENTLNSAYYSGGAEITAENKLILPINQVATDQELPPVGKVVVTVTSDNYKNYTITINVSPRNKVAPVPSGTIRASSITYGESLSKSKITGWMQHPTAHNDVKGVFRWKDDTIRPNAGDYVAEWIFIPDESYGGAYLTATGTATVTVNPKVVTVSGITANDKAYDGTTDAELVFSNATFDGIQGNDTLTATAKGKFANANVGNQPVTISDLILGGDSAANYVLATEGNQTETTATITAKEVTVSGITANDKAYDGTTNAALDCSNAKFNGILENDKLTVTAKGVFEKAEAGKWNVAISDLTLGGDSAANYVLAESGNQTETTATITAKQITVSITSNGGTYGETITPATVKANDVVSGEKPTITLTYTGTANDGTEYTGTTPPAKAGTYTVTATTTDNNYTLDANTAIAEFTVTKRRATVTPDDNQFKVYEEKDPELTYKVSGVLDGETLKGITLTRAEGENAGEYAITATADAGANPNYDVTFAEGKFTINPKPIDSATVKLGAGLTANGAEQTQTVDKVMLGGKELPADSYTVTDNTATAPGKYTLTITAKGNYTGTVKQTYAIAPAKAEDAPGEEIAIGIGKVNVNVQSEGAVPPAALLTDKAELLAMLVDSGDITADELAQIANGANVDIVLTVKEANVHDEVKAAMAQATKDYTIGQYLDISLFKYMTVNGSQQDDVALRTTKNALTISVAVPDALINTNSAVNRTYCIVRRHDGAITVLDAAFDAASKTLTFKTDRFSDYAIAYKDTAVPGSGSNPSSNNSSNDSETKKNEVAAPTPAPTPASSSKPSTITAMPQTGDTSNPTLYVVLLVASLLGLAVVFVCKKRNDK